jgi:hypothetical protein
MIEPADIADFGDKADGGDERDPAERLQGVHHRRPAPAGGELPELVRQALDAAFGFIERVAILMQRDVLRG